MQRVSVRVPARREAYEITIGAEVLARLGRVAHRTLSPHARRLVIVSNPKVFGLYGERAAESLQREGFSVARWLMSDGERHKTLSTMTRLLAFLSGSGLERSDALVALGGGVVGDLCGFAAAVHLRGLALLQVPTTLLAQVDASVGGKVAVNTSKGKNLVGAFHHPRAVLIDTSTLSTLPQRELTAGWCESIKQGAAGERRLFDETQDFLRNFSKDESALRSARLEKLIASQVAFKAAIVAGDEREEVSRTDHRSRRILNFGHTTAHALEALTRFRRFRHGEAVGYGMLVAAEISKRLGLLAPSELELLRGAVGLCGSLPRANDLDEGRLLSLIARDKKSVGGDLKWVLLERIGRAKIVDGREIPRSLLRASIRTGLQGVAANRE